MCSVDRRRYRDGDFNGHWTSQLAPSQCSGTLFSLPPPILSFSLYPLSPLLSTFLSLLLFFPLVLFLFLHIFLLIFLPVPPRFVFSLHRSAGLSSRYRLSLSLLLSLLVSAPKSNSRSICDLEGFRAEAGHYEPLSSPRTREHRIRGSYLIREEVYSPVDSNWARNHRALLFSFRTLKKTLTNSRFLAYYCRIAPPPPPPFSSAPFVSLSKLFSPSPFWIFSEQTSF